MVVVLKHKFTHLHVHTTFQILWKQPKGTLLPKCQCVVQPHPGVMAIQPGHYILIDTENHYVSKTNISVGQTCRSYRSKFHKQKLWSDSFLKIIIHIKERSKIIKIWCRCNAIFRPITLDHLCYHLFLRHSPYYWILFLFHQVVASWDL